MQTTHEQAIEAAVNYWAGFLTSNDAPPRNNGDDSGTMFLVLSLMAANHTAQPADKVEIFKSWLREHLETRLNGTYPSIELRVDYNPEGALLDALMSAAIPSPRDAGPFPWKTSMYVSRSEVYVYQGRGADKRVLWSAETAE